MIELHTADLKPKKEKEPNNRTLVIQIKQEQTNTQILKELQTAFLHYPGQDQINMIILNDNNSSKKIKPSLQIDSKSENLLLEVEKILGPKSFQII